MSDLEPGACQQRGSSGTGLRSLLPGKSLSLHGGTRWGTHLTLEQRGQKEKQLLTHVHMCNKSVLFSLYCSFQRLPFLSGVGFVFSK